MSDLDGYNGPWTLSGTYPARKLTRTSPEGDSVEWLFEDDGDKAFKDKLASIAAEHGVWSTRKPEPARPKTTVDVKLVHLVRKEGAPLDGPTNVVYGPIDTANDAIIIAHLLNTKCDLLDEGEQFEAVTRKTTVEVTIL